MMSLKQFFNSAEWVALKAKYSEETLNKLFKRVTKLEEKVKELEEKSV